MEVSLGVDPPGSGQALGLVSDELGLDPRLVSVTERAGSTDQGVPRTRRPLEANLQGRLAQPARQAIVIGSEKRRGLLVTELSLLARRLREGREQSPGIPEVPGERCRSELLPESGFGGPMGKGQGMGSHPRRILAPRVHEGRMEGAEGPRLTAVHPE